MTDRRLKATKNSDGTFTLSGVAYEADRPNINNVVYPREVLAKALEEYLEKPEEDRLLTVGCAPRPHLATKIGVVIRGEIVENDVLIEARTLKGNFFAAAVAAHHCAFALAGTGMSSKIEGNDPVVIRDFEITSMGVVGVEEVIAGEESSDDGA